MPKKEIKFNLPGWVVVNLGAFKYTLDGITVFGLGSEIAEPSFKFVPIATLIFFLAGRYVGYILKAYVQQGLPEDDAK